MGGLRSIAPGLAAALLAILVYAATLGHGPAYDDVFILRSPLLAEPWNLRELFSDGFYARPERTLGLYRPLGQGSLVWNAVLARALTGRLDVWALFHAANVLLHAAASFLLFLWLARLPLPRFAAGAAAILWAVHPVHAEVAANVTARYESLALVLGLGFLVAFRAGRPLLSPCLLLAALLCKESALAFLPLALAADALLPAFGRRFDARKWIAPAAAVVAWWFLRAAAIAGEETSPPYVENPVAAGSAGVRALTAAKVQVLYLRDQLLPLWLSTDHSFRQIAPVRTLLDPLVIGFAALVLAAAALAWRFRTRRPEIALCVLGYAILFAPASNFVFPIGTIMADRLAYAPSIFTALLAALAVAACVPRPGGPALVAVLGVLLSLAGVRQAAVWKDELALFRDQVRTAPESAKSHGNLGDALRERGELAEAVREYERSISIYPFRPEPHLGLAQAYEALRADPEVVLETWADSIRYGTRGERPVLKEILAAVDLGDFGAVEALRAQMAAADPEDRFLPRVDHLRIAARSLALEPRTGEDFARAAELFRRSEWAAADAKYRRAMHRRDLPEAEIRNALLAMAVCSEHLERPARAEHLRKLAAGLDSGRK